MKSSASELGLNVQKHQLMRGDKKTPDKKEAQKENKINTFHWGIELMIRSFNYYAVVPANQILLAIFTLSFTSLPFIPTNVMSYLFLVRGSWTSPLAITGEPGIAGNSTSVPYLSNRSTTSSLPTPSGGPSI